MIPRPKQSSGLLILSFSFLSLVLTVVGEGVNTLVAAGVSMCVVYDYIVRGDRQVNPQLVAGQTTLGLGGQRIQSLYIQLAAAGYFNSPAINQHFMKAKHTEFHWNCFWASDSTSRLLLGGLRGTSSWEERDLKPYLRTSDCF